jgi:hypothetical protein
MTKVYFRRLIIPIAAALAGLVDFAIALNGKHLRGCDLGAITWRCRLGVAAGVSASRRW